MLRLIVGFIGGMAVCGMLVIGAQTVLPLWADEDPTANTTENITLSLVNLIPNVEAIYEESLTLPFAKAESKIYDEDIAEFYSELMDRTGLR